MEPFREEPPWSTTQLSAVSVYEVKVSRSEAVFRCGLCSVCGGRRRLTERVGGRGALCLRRTAAADGAGRRARRALSAEDGGG